MRISKILFLSLFLSLISLNLNAQIGESLYTQNREIIDKLIVAVIGAILGFLFNYILTKRRERLDIKQLSYDLKVNNVIIKADRAIKDNIKYKYKENEYSNLSLVTCQVQNTGNKLVKNEKLRFEFDNKVKILEVYFDPIPEPELEIKSDDTELTRFDFERKYIFGHLVKNKKVTLNLIITGENPNPKIHDKNEAGDVEFLEGSISKVKHDKEILKEFFMINLSFLILIPTFYFFTNLVYSKFIIGGIGLVYFISNLFYLKHVTRILSDLIFKNPATKDVSQFNNITVHGNENVVLQDIRDGDIKMNRKPKDESL